MIKTGKVKAGAWGWIAIILVCLSFCCLEVMPAFADVNLEALNRFKVGRSYLKKNLYMQAITELKAAVEIQPDYVDALYVLGLAYRGNRDIKEAKECFNKVVELSPKFPAPYLQLADMYSSEGDYAQAHKTLDLMANCVPASFEISYARGVVYYQEGKLDASITAWLKTVAEKPDYAPAHHNLACAFFIAGKTETALNEISTAIKLEPADAAHVFQLAWFHFRSNQDKAALEALGRVALLKSQPFYQALGEAYRLFINRDFDRAQAKLTEAAQLKPDSSFVLYLQGRIYEHQAQWSEALKQYETGARLEPLEPAFSEGINQVKSKE